MSHPVLRLVPRRAAGCMAISGSVVEQVQVQAPVGTRQKEIHTRRCANII